MVMGIIILRRRYDIWKYISVIMITFGIILCTIVSGSKVEKIKATEAAAAELDAKTEAMGFSVFFWWTLGITLLTVALFLSARMGIYQEVLYKRYGKHPNEALFYTVSLTLRTSVWCKTGCIANSGISIFIVLHLLFCYNAK